jgi:hypothetical protein
MSLLPFLDIGMKLIERLIPNPEQKAQAQLELMKLEQNGELALLTADTQLAMGQIETNKLEAASDDNFTRRARPFIMWVCGFAFAYHFILQPLLAFGFAAFHHPVPLPVFDMDALNTVLMGLLGLGGMRSFDKAKRLMR